MRKIPGTILKLFLVSLAVALRAAPACFAQQVSLTPENKTGVYKVGETARWQVTLAGPDAPAFKQASYVLKRDGLAVLKDGTLDLSSGHATLEAELDQPGTVLAEIKTKAGDKENKTLAGAVFSPEKIKPSSPPPEDFDAFWAAKVKELEEVPA